MDWLNRTRLNCRYLIVLYDDWRSKYKQRINYFAEVGEEEVDFHQIVVVAVVDKICAISIWPVCYSSRLLDDNYVATKQSFLTRSTSSTENDDDRFVNGEDLPLLGKRCSEELDMVVHLETIKTTRYLFIYFFFQNLNNLKIYKRRFSMYHIVK